jgi:hypothetical protein
MEGDPYGPTKALKCYGIEYFPDESISLSIGRVRRDLVQASR